MIVFILIVIVCAIWVSSDITLADINPGGVTGSVNEKVYSFPENSNSIETVSVPVTIYLAGDVLLASGVGRVMTKYGIDYPWEKVAALLKEGDIAAANLECCISERGRPEPDKQFTFRAAPGVLAGAKRAGMDVFTLANNHVLDFGPEAMKDTLDHLDNNGIDYTGAGMNLYGATRPVIVEKKGLKVGFLAFSRVFPSGSWVAGPKKWGMASGYDVDLVKDSVEYLARQADFVVVSLHWGKEMAEYPRKEDVRFGHMLVDAGADMVLGHHPHVIQGIEFYKNKMIAYSAGNFIFSSPSPKALEGMIIQVEAENKKIGRARIIPTGIINAQPHILQGKQREKVLQRVRDLSKGMNSTVDAEGFLNPIYKVNGGKCAIYSGNRSPDPG